MPPLSLAHLPQNTVPVISQGVAMSALGPEALSGGRQPPWEMRVGYQPNPEWADGGSTGAHRAGRLCLRPEDGTSSGKRGCEWVQREREARGLAMINENYNHGN